MIDPYRHRARVAGALLFGLTAGLFLSARSPGVAQSGGPELPRHCRAGEIVVSDGFDRFRCTGMRLAGCGDGYLVTTDHNGELTCVRPSSCGSGGVLTLDSFGRPACVDSPGGERSLLPDCPRGSTLVSRGGGSWECARR